MRKFFNQSLNRAHVLSTNFLYKSPNAACDKPVHCIIFDLLDVGLPLSSKFQTARNIYPRIKRNGTELNPISYVTCWHSFGFEVIEVGKKILLLFDLIKLAILG